VAERWVSYWFYLRLGTLFPSFPSLSARFDQNNCSELSRNPSKTSRVWDIPVPRVLFLSRGENVPLSVMFGRIREEWLINREEMSRN